ncbi:MAG TPA: amidohydrolase family protein [Steroidobacteraceae bacterium]|nr:amidohydrolase family protein [Steroidobacteraceae bacterium]
MARTTFINARIFDGSQAEYLEESVVVVEGNRIAEVGRQLPASNAGEVLDVRGCTLMPGLIDAHCHVLGSSVKIAEVETQPLTYVAQHGARMLSHALDCGFTTIRDVGGGEVGIAQAVEHGLIRGPRVLFAGRAMSMTGGHGDFRDPVSSAGACSCCAEGRVSVIVDSKDAMRAAVREELRRGAHCIKLMMSGGVLSPSDPLWMDQFSDEEVLVAVEETARRRKYVAAHCHPAASIARAARLGVRSIEHATLIDAGSAEAVKSAGAFVVPTLVIVSALLDSAKTGGLPEWAAEKLRVVSEHSLRGLEMMDRMGLKIGFGTDLLGKLHVQQTREFLLRREVQSPLAILRAATSTNAELLGEATLGRIQAGNEADILIVEGDPLKDIGLLASDGRTLRAIMKAGVFYKRPA